MNNLEKNRIRHVLALLLLAGHGDLFADCYFNDGAYPLTASEASLPGPGVINMPADLENDRTIYEGTLMARGTNNITCTGTSPIGIVLDPAFGSTPQSGHTFPLKNSGIGIQIIGSNFGDPQPISAYGQKTIGSGNVWGAYGPQFTFRFVRIGKVKHGTVVGPFKIGSIKFANLVTHNLTLTNKLVISASSCKTPDVSVNMGDYVASEVTNSRGQTNPVNFDIALNQCPEGIDRVTYTLQANTSVIDREGGLVALDATSTVKGVGLRIMDGDGTALALDKAHVFNGYDVKGGNFKIPLSAAYVRIEDQELGFGTANTALTFTMSYL